MPPRTDAPPVHPNHPASFFSCTCTFVLWIVECRVYRVHRDSVELYNRYRFTYEVLIVSILTYILEIVPPDLLHHPLDLMEMLDELNPGERSAPYCKSAPVYIFQPLDFKVIFTNCAPL